MTSVFGGKINQPRAVEELVGLSAAEVERALILATLDATQGNRTRAADILKISLRTLRNKLALYRIADAAGDSADPDAVIVIPPGD